MELKQAMEILQEQEKILVFDQFDCGDAWKLGTQIAKEAREKKLPIAVTIRVNGYRLFQYGHTGSTPDNERWMTRKYNTVLNLHTSSLQLRASLERNGETMENRALPVPEFAFAGGAFPIRIKDTGVVGAIVVSGLSYDVDNHNLVVSNISRYLGKQVPMFARM